MPVSDKDHGGVAVTPAVAPGGGHKPLDLGLRQVLAGAQVAIGAPAGHNCSFYDSWRDHPEMSFRHVFGPPSLTYWSYNDHFSNSAGELSTGSTARPHYRPHVHLAGRDGRTESQVIGTSLQGSAGDISAGRARARPQSTIHTANTAACDR